MEGLLANLSSNALRRLDNCAPLGSASNINVLAMVFCFPLAPSSTFLQQRFSGPHQLPTQGSSFAELTPGLTTEAFGKLRHFELVDEKLRLIELAIYWKGLPSLRADQQLAVSPTTFATVCGETPGATAVLAVAMARSPFGAGLNPPLRRE